MQKLHINSKKVLPLLFSLLLLFSGCDSIGSDFDFNGDLRNKVQNDTSVTFTFYEYPDVKSQHKDVTIYTGKTLKKEDFPIFEHEDQYFVGFKYFNTSRKSDKIPSNIKTDENGIVQSISAATASETFCVEWKNKYLVTFETNCEIEIEPVYLPEGDLVSSPEIDYKRGNFRFRKWYKDEALTELYDFDEPVTGNLTLYAKWVEVHTIIYHKMMEQTK